MKVKVYHRSGLHLQTLADISTVDVSQDSFCHVEWWALMCHAILNWSLTSKFEVYHLHI